MSELESIKGWGITFEKPSEDTVVLPDDITSIPSEALGELFTKLVAWTDYIASQKVMAELDERSAKRKLDFAENTLLVKRMGSQTKGERITTVKAEISIDPEIVALDNEHETKYAYRRYVEMLLNNHERDLSLVSREITRRANDLRSTRKEYGV